MCALAASCIYLPQRELIRIARLAVLRRFDFWAHRRHMSHFLLSVLAVLPDAKPYEELRKGYNSVRAEDAPEAPPYGEWTMIGLCDHVFCR